MRWVPVLLIVAGYSSIAWSEDPVGLSEIAPESLLVDIPFSEIDYQLIRVERIIWMEYYGAKDKVAQAGRTATHHITKPSLDQYSAYLIKLRYDRNTDKIIVVSDLLPYAPRSHFFEELKWERMEHIEEVSRYLFDKIAAVLPWIEDNPEVVIIHYRALNRNKELIDVARQIGRDVTILNITGK